MKKADLLLLITALAFLSFGLYGFLRPEIVPALRLYTLSPTAGPGELRAYYGDFELGFGAFLLAAALTPRYREPAHLAAALTLGIIACGRAIWVARGTEPTAPLLLSAAAEIALAALNLYAFRRAKRLARNAAER